jgi:hypothetical protein
VGPETSSNAPFPTRYGEILRDEIAHTVADPADVEDEVRALFAALAR